MINNSVQNFTTGSSDSSDAAFGYMLLMDSRRLRGEAVDPTTRLGVHVLFVHGGPATAVVRADSGEAVVLLSGEMPDALSDANVAELCDLAAAVLDPEELVDFNQCLQDLRQRSDAQQVKVANSVLTIQAASDHGRNRFSFSRYLPSKRSDSGIDNASDLQVAQTAPAMAYLAQAIQLRAAAEELEEMAVFLEKSRGASWEEIGSHLGVSKGTSYGRYSARYRAWRAEGGTPQEQVFGSAYRDLESRWDRITSLIQQRQVMDSLRDAANSLDSAQEVIGGEYRSDAHQSLAGMGERLPSPRSEENFNAPGFGANDVPTSSLDTKSQQFAARIEKIEQRQERLEEALRILGGQLNI